MTTAKPKPKHLSEILGGMDEEKGLTVGELMQLMGERTFGALMFIFAVPNAIPTPPGTSTVLGLPLLFFTFQLMVGRQVPWLPKAIASRNVSAGLLAAFKRKGLPWLIRLEKILKPRLPILIRSDAAERVLGTVCFILAVILFLPVPLVNILPAIAISILSLSLIERDGLVALIGYAAAIATCVFMYVISASIWVGITALYSWIFG